MIGSVYQSCLQAHNRITGQRSLENAFLNSLLYSREVVSRNSAAEDSLLKYIGLLQIAGGLELPFDIAVLSVSAGLLLMFTLYLNLLAQGFTECKFRFGQSNVNLITALKLAYHHIQLLVANTIQQRLTVLRIIDHLKGLVFFHHT